MRTWEQKSATLWLYHTPGSALVSGYVVWYRWAQSAEVAWDAVVVSTRGGTDLTVDRGVSLDDAKRAVEQYVATHPHEP